MFYSRPKIAPLGWDLEALPVPEGSKDFMARTAEGRPVDFRFSGGWLSVGIGAPGAGFENPMQTALEAAIAPFGVMDIHPEQICDILGVTVRGAKVALHDYPAGARGFDWSGRTTYWESEHRLLREETGDFVEDMKHTFPGAALLQPAWRPPVLKVRQVAFFLDTDKYVQVGIGAKEGQPRLVLNDPALTYEKLEAAFTHVIHFSRADESWSDASGRAAVLRAGVDQLKLDYDVPVPAIFRVTTTYVTEDPAGLEYIDKFLTMLDRHFVVGAQYVDLQTRTVLKDAPEWGSYSRKLKDWCLQRPQRYLMVGAETPKSRASAGAEALGSDGTVFYGLRPAAA